MQKRKVNTSYGEVEFYVLEDIYPGLAFFIKSPKEEAEIEFPVPETELSIEQQERRVQFFMSAYERGRQRGIWERTIKLRDLFDEMKRLAY